MKKAVFLILLLTVFSLVFSGIILAQAKKRGAVAATGVSLWDYLKKQAYAKNWQMWPGTTGMYEGPEPHGAFLTTYVNDVALKSISAKKGKFADGAIIAQDNFSKDKKLKFISVIYKVKGYNPQGGDWFWVQYKPDGRIESEGKIDECIKCHEAQKGNDYVYTGKLK
ncbi:MAG TPA: cytochrome P460 family protein [Syntrophales bacterium]|nr:cytochrome P460 family protein [Syntrophales bacterium]